MIEAIRHLLSRGKLPRRDDSPKVRCWGCALMFPSEVIDWRSGPHPLCPCCRKDIEYIRERRR